MRIQQLYQLKTPMWSSAMAAGALGVRAPSAKIACHRYAKKGLVVRLKRDLYATRQAWDHFREEDFFMAANRLQVPSYVSFTTALSYYQITTQVQKSFIESVGTVRSWSQEVEGVQFRYTKLPAGLYRGFVKKENFFIALPEKAFLDTLYLTALGRYRFDLSAMDLGKMDPKEIGKQSKIFPRKMRDRMQALWKR